MNKKGEITVGLILMGFIGILVALILLQGTFPFLGASTNSYELRNHTISTGLPNTVVDLRGQELLSTPVVTNRSGTNVLTSGNYSITEGISAVDGLKRIRFSLTAAGGASGYNSSNLNISYDYGQEGYIDDAGGRGVANLIPIMAAIALVVFAIALGVKERFF